VHAIMRSSVDAVDLALKRHRICVQHLAAVRSVPFPDDEATAEPA